MLETDILFLNQFIICHWHFLSILIINVTVAYVTGFRNRFSYSLIKQKTIIS